MAEFFCTACGTPFANAYPLDREGRCGLCRRGIIGFDAAYAFGSYEGVLRELVHLFKYGRVRALAKPLGDLMASTLPRMQRFDIVTPMPMHWLRRWQRGFNQAELLAAEVARRYAIRPEKILRRRKGTPPQAGLSRSARRQNVTGAFEVTKGARIQDKRILLIDDVLTTGATASACAAAMKRGGAKYVAVLALARADRRPAEAFGTLAVTSTTAVGSVIDA